jgi:hypothetical protein
MAKSFQTTQINSDLPSQKENKEKGKERIGEWYLIAGGVTKKKNEEIATTNGTGPKIKKKPIHKTPIKPKEKGMAKVSKGKAKEKESHDTAIGRKTPTTRIIKTMRKSQ